MSDFECVKCNGEGCTPCSDTGWVECVGGARCPLEASQGTCHCQSAWERQQEDYASEPPLSAQERHEIAWREHREAHR